MYSPKDPFEGFKPQSEVKDHLSKGSEEWLAQLDDVTRELKCYTTSMLDVLRTIKQTESLYAESSGEAMLLSQKQSNLLDVQNLSGNV
jgi:hypothetical protein